VDHLAAALQIASQGIPVFPLAPRSKFPLIAAADGGHGLHDATTDAAQIQAWWTAHPTGNIGLRTGVAFDVVDLDSEAAVDALESARAGRERFGGPVVATAKGFHYFVLPTLLGNRAGVCRVSTSGEQAGTWRHRPRSIRQAFGTAGSSMIASAQLRPGWLN